MGDARGDHASASVLRAATLSRRLLTKAPWPFLGRAQLVVDRIVDEGGNDLAVALQRDGDGEQRNAVQEVGGAVERVDDPAMGLVGPLRPPALLHQEAIAGTGLRQLPVQGLLGTVVGAGGEVGGALDGNLQLLDLAEVARQAAAGLPGGGDHDVHQG